MDRSLYARIITGIILIVIAVLVLYQGGQILTYTALLLFLVINWEFCLMVPTAIVSERVMLFLINLGTLPLLLWRGFSGLGAYLIFAVIFLSTLSCIWVDRNKHDRTVPVDSFFLGLCYVGVLGSFMVYFTRVPNSNSIIAWILAIVVASDTFAYFGGKYFGKKKMSVKISPNKTVFGMYSGFTGAVVASASIGPIANVSATIAQLLFYGFVIGAVAQIGDLFESLIKRRFGVKDSSHFLPGHGGFLDRIDALLFALPIAYLIIIADIKFN